MTNKVVSRIKLTQERVPADIPEMKISSADDVVKAVKSLPHADREKFLALHLDTRNNLNAVEEIAVGALNATLVHPRETFKNAIINQSAAIVIVHNHPSGDPEPSDEDITICKLMVQAGKFLGIEVLDCVIVADDKKFSMAEQSPESLKGVE